MARYRATKYSPFDNTQYRVEILPYDNDLSASVTTLDAGTVLEIGDHEYGFDDELPYGLAPASTWSVKLNFSRLPSALQTYLRAKMSGDARNTFMYWTDNGTSGATWALLFCGVVEEVESVDYEPLDNGEYAATYQCIDALHFTLSQLIPETVFSVTGDVVDYFKRIYDVGSPSYVNSDSWYSVDMGSNGVINYAAVGRWTSVVDRMQSQIAGYLDTNITRSANAVAATGAASDYQDRLDELVNTGARFYEASKTSPRSRSTQLTGTSTLIAKTIVNKDSEVLGGMYSVNDEYSFAQAQSLIDNFTDFAETFGVKVCWFPEYVTSGSGDYIRWNWLVACWLSNGRSDGAATAHDVSSEAVSFLEITEGAGIVGKVESRISLSSNGDRDVSEWVYASGRSRSSRSINFEPVLHNVPTFKDRILPQSGTVGDNMQLGFRQTNLILIQDTTNGSNVEKAHEDVRVVVRGAANGGAETTYYETTWATDFPDLTSFSSSLVGVSAAYVQGWLNEAQLTACLPYTLAYAIYSTFGNELQASAVVEYPTASDVMVSELGKVHDLQSGAASVFSHLQWDKACVCKVVHSFTNGTCTVSYFIPEV